VLVVAATERELAAVSRADVFVCGIGPVEAAVQTSRMLAALSPDAVLHVGIAGGRGLEPLTIVAGSASVYSDVAAAIPVVDHIEPDTTLLERVRRTVPEARVLPIGTSAAVDGGTGCEVEAMEGFGVLRACELAGVPAVELRVISNDPAEPDRAKWRFDEAFEVLGDAVARVLAD
jgi:predicted 5'-methylthioadenosine/S-adenosylhomocysteine nucleosidase